MSDIDFSAVTGWDLVWAGGFAIAGWIASVLGARGITAVLRRTPGVSETLITLSSRVVRYLFILLGIGIGLGFLGVGVQPLVAIAIIIGVVLVLVLRGVADNFASGVVLQTRQPIHVGDEIEVDGMAATVIELNGRSVILHTADGRAIHVPNSKLLGEPIINHSALGGRRSDVQVRVERGGHDVDGILHTMADAATAAASNTATPTDPPRPAQALPIAISPERVIARVQFWHDPLQGLSTRAAVVHAVSAALEHAGLVGTVTSMGDVPPPLAPPDSL